MEVLPWAAPEELPRGHSPACLTSARGVVNRAGPPVSARIAAAPVTVSPPIVVTSSVSPRSSRTAHPRPGIGEPGAGIAPVAQRQVRAFQGAGAVRGDAGGTGQRGGHGPDDPQARPDPAPPGQLPPHRRGEPVQAQAPDAARVPGAPVQHHGQRRAPGHRPEPGCPMRPAPQATRIPADPGPGSPPPSRRSSAGCGALPGDAAAPIPHPRARARNSAAHWPAARSAPRPSGPTCPGSGPRPRGPGRPAAAARIPAPAPARRPADPGPATGARPARTPPSPTQNPPLTPGHGPVQHLAQLPGPGTDPAPGDHPRIMIGHHGGLRLIRQVDPHDRMSERHQFPQPRQPGAAMAVPTRQATTWTAPSFLEAVISGKVGTHAITEAAPG